jgi:hypothetical protein
MKSQQLSLLDLPADPTAAVKAAMARSVRESGKSRAEVLDVINSLAASAGIRLSKNAKNLSPDTWEKWLNPADREHLPSLAALTIICRVIGPSPLAVLAQASGGYHCIDAQQAKLLQRAEIDAEIARLKAQKKRLEATL